MKHLLLACLASVILSSCAKSIANFAIVQDETKVPATANFKALSDDADQLIWSIDGDVYTESEINHRFIKSGKHDVTLTANKGSKSKSVTKEIVFDAPDKCLVEISTPHGSMLVELYEDTPKHRDNFLKLADETFYNGTLFHRVINGFMIQGGDPNSKGAGANARLGAGGPGYQIDAEFDERFAHVKGALAAARTGDQGNPQKRSSGSQFYIVHGKEVTEAELDRTESQKGLTYSDEMRAAYLKDGGTPFLDGAYTVFGRVVEGLDIIDKIADVKTGQGDRPQENVSMEVNVIK